jgi:hypothetical protein
MSPIDWVSLREIVLLFVKCSSAAFSYLIVPMMSHAKVDSSAKPHCSIAPKAQPAPVPLM